MVTPYLWASSIRTDLEHARAPVSGTAKLKFDDILDKVDGAFQIHAEGQGDHFGAFADFTYLGLSDSNQFNLFRSESDLDTRLFEMAAVWNPSPERFRGGDVFAGLRYLDVKLTVQLIPVNPAIDTFKVDSSDTFSDFMIGGRYTWALSEHWGLTLRGDTSFGETDGTWNASVVANYRTRHGASALRLSLPRWRHFRQTPRPISP